MPQYRIFELEARRDWPLIVTSVPCRVCSADIGALCRDVSAMKIQNQIVVRTDYHAERKYDAAQAWHNAQQVTVPENPREASEAPSESVAAQTDAPTETVTAEAETKPAEAETQDETQDTFQNIREIPRRKKK